MMLIANRDMPGSVSEAPGSIDEKIANDAVEERARFARFVARSKPYHSHKCILNKILRVLLTAQAYAKTRQEPRRLGAIKRLKANQLSFIVPRLTRDARLILFGDTHAPSDWMHRVHHVGDHYKSTPRNIGRQSRYFLLETRLPGRC